MNRIEELLNNAQQTLTELADYLIKEPEQYAVILSMIRELQYSINDKLEDIEK